MNLQYFFQYYCQKNSREEKYCHTGENMIDGEDGPNIAPDDTGQRAYPKTDTSWKTVDNAPLLTYCYIGQEAVMYGLEHEIDCSQDTGYTNQSPSC